MSTPALPYRESDGTRTVGWSGTDTSRERAQRETKTAGAKQRRVLRSLKMLGAHGITVRELCEATGWHHGTASGVLSNLNSVHRLDMLDERRNRQHVYVLPQFRHERALATRRVKQPADILAAQAYILFEQQRQRAALFDLERTSWAELPEHVRQSWRDEAQSIIDAAN